MNVYAKRSCHSMTSPISAIHPGMHVYHGPLISAWCDETFCDASCQLNAWLYRSGDDIARSVICQTLT